MSKDGRNCDDDMLHMERRPGGGGGGVGAMGAIAMVIILGCVMWLVFG